MKCFLSNHQKIIKKNVGLKYMVQLYREFVLIGMANWMEMSEW